jgi:hypothetical protein
MQSQRSTRLELEHLEDRRLMSTTPGLTAQYYTGQTLQTLRATRIDPNVDFTWNNVSPAAGVSSTNFSVRWTGQIYIAQSGVYSFGTLSDDGIKLIVNGQTLINDWTTHAPRNDYASTWLAGGKWYSIEVDYHQGTGGSVAQLSWAPPGKHWQIIPESVLSTTTPGPAPAPAPVKGSPGATLSASMISTAGGPSASFSVTYNDTVALNGATIGTGDVVVTGPNGFKQTAVLTGVTHSANDETYTATYKITAPGGKWDAGDNGSYTVTLQAGQVEDTTGVWESGRVLGSFPVAIPGSPTAWLTASKVAAAGGTSASFIVTYNDTVALNGATIGTGDVVVTGPNGFKQTAVLTGLTHSADGKTYYATYRITAPGGTWEPWDNGSYTVTLQPGQVEDSAGVWASGRVLGAFQVAVPGSPTATLSAGNVTVPGGTSTYFTVTYRDTVAFNAATIGTGDVLVTGPKGYKQTAVLTSVTHSTDGKTYTATYKITPPGGTWDSGDNGAYTVTLQAGRVEDSTGVWASGRSLGSFQVLLQGDDWFSDNLTNANLQVLARQLLTDGTLSRNDAIQLLDSAEGSGSSLSASELQDLRTLFDGSGHPYWIPGYVQNLADKVIDGNAGNDVGNLYAGSASWRLGDLIGQWFLGADQPATASGLTYTYAAGSLLGGGPTYSQIVQGGVGDCYFLSALAETALCSPAAIENMFIDNGDGTYTVRFYEPDGQADYVTVNREVPTRPDGTYAYANLGEQVNNANNVIWVALAEKAYAQLAGSGWSRGNTASAYSSINLGWEGDVLHQIDNDDASYNTLSWSSQNAITNAFWSNHLVALDTKDSTATGIVPNHVYILLNYNSSNGTYTLYNPWGYTQTLNWSQVASNFNAWSNGNPV